MPATMTGRAAVARFERAIAATVAPKSRRKARKARSQVTRALALMSLPEYLAWLNRDSDGFALTEDLDHWAQSKVYTATDLGAYLDSCVRREREKDLRNGYYDD